jgi:hypothetical protein
MSASTETRPPDLRLVFGETSSREAKLQFERAKEWVSGGALGFSSRIECLINNPKPQDRLLGPVWQVTVDFWVFDDDTRDCLLQVAPPEGAEWVDVKEAASR